MRRRFKPFDRLASFRFAWRGIRTLVADEHNARIHLAATLGVVIVAALLGLAADEWRWLILAITMVWTAEAFNTAIERLGNAVTRAPDVNIGAAKDIAAAAVLAASLAAAIIGASVFLPHFSDWQAHKPLAHPQPTL